MPSDVAADCPVCRTGTARGPTPVEANTVVRPPDEPPRFVGQTAATNTWVPPGFELLEELSRGGMGMVYKVRQTALNRVVALKVISPAAVAIPDVRERFAREVRATARMNHPNVVTVYHTELDGAVPYLVMEYVPGVDLFRLVERDGPLPVATAVGYARQVAEGLRHTHEQGIVHRDIKPSNLIVTTDTGEGGGAARVKILDMGIARPAVVVEPGAPDDLTEVGLFLGTPDYVSPEQAEDSRAADARSDVFSLGATLYFLLTGKVPFPGRTLYEKARKTLTGPPPSPATVRADVPEALDRVVRRMLARDPTARYQTAAEVIAALDGVTRSGFAPATPSDQPGNSRMSSSFFDRERAALARLAEAVRARAASEAEIAAAFQAASDKAEREVGRARKQNATAREKELGEIDSEHEAAAQEIVGRFDAEQFTVNRNREQKRATTVERYNAAVSKGKAEFKDQLWANDSMLEAGEKRARDQMETVQRKAAAAAQRAEALWKEAEPLVVRAKSSRSAVERPDMKLAPDGDPYTRVEQTYEAAKAAIEDLRRTVRGAWFVFTSSKRERIRAVAATAGERVSAAQAACRMLHDFAANVYAAEHRRQLETHARKKQETEGHYHPRFAAQKKQYEADLDRIIEDHANSTDSVIRLREAETRSEEEGYRTRRGEAEARLNAQLQAAESAYTEKMAAAGATRDAAWQRAADEWHAAMSDVTEAFGVLRTEGGRLYPHWEQVTRDDRPLPTAVPPGVRFGDLTVNMAELPDGVSADARLAPPPELSGIVPAFVPFPAGSSVVLKARDDGRAAAVNALQATMLRFLTGFPPGKVRFTIIDPVGLGENFAAFMHLADFDEKLVGGRISVEPREIADRLEDLTEQIAMVQQKYLRNQYKTIEDYNRAAGEVAEPYRVLVVANFPAGFTPESAARLISIAKSGPACGVCTLVSVDSKAALPRDFNLSDFEAPSFVLNHRDGQFTPKDPAFAPFALAVDRPPDPATIAKLVQRVGKGSKEAARVEVPFEYIAPKPADVWRGSAAKCFEVPVGRAGATRRQMFTLGRGTAQHALVAGKTGSGKSTLLHALITNLALQYSPEEAELYLIDFKEGVEFQWYANYRLPHARVVAIQSEREFGLSVLQRLDGILRERGERFRDAGVNDLAGYRAAKPNEITPRILFVVDEFQQFFVEDDKLSQEAALLLDRLVRQGRAFGMHVLLGSQTLGGAYSLARSTIDQMAVRVALQCSDADAQLILSKDNSAARLLSRPGEAIYNDQNGLVEGNDPFQVVWLSEEKREQLLRELGERADGKYPPPLVFEGNSAADPAKNPALSRVLEASEWRETKAPVAWLGDPVAIKEPTAAPFRAQGGANLLLIGQNEEAARGLFGAALLGLAGQLPPQDSPTATFTVLDGTPDDMEDAEYLRRLAGRLPHTTRAPGRAELATALAELAGELDRRQKGESADRSPRFLFVFGVHRFRELRKAEDDFGFRRGAEREVSPAERFASILREGAPLGIHVVVWCDSLTNLNRSFDRPLLREFGMRVLFQMSPTDSSTLMDSPAASRLGRNRALFLQEEQERPEKFRPYGLPDAAWLTAAAEQLHRRVGLKEAAAGV